MMKRILYLGFILALFGCKQSVIQNDWPVYGGNSERMQYSPLDFIDTSNVQNLEVAWVYHTGDSARGTQMQTNPLIVDTVLYGVSPKLKLFAVEARSGKEIWTFDPAHILDNSNPTANIHGMNVCRGVAYYSDGKGKSRIFYTVGSFLYSIDALNGVPDPKFGEGGKISLHEGFDVERDIKHLRVTSTSPGIIYRDLIIMGSSLNEEEESAPGDIRAFNVHTGKREWIFHSVPYPGEVGYETWADPESYKYIGGANTWGGFSLDKKRGLVFAATGTSNPDFYGGKRVGDNLFSNSVVALDAATGKRKWHFQTVHHDLWDWDLPTAPTLVSVEVNGKKRDVVVQVTKQGFVYVLDRDTGEPVHPIEERPVPTDTELLGEVPSPTQPIPVNIAPFIRQEMKMEDINPYLPDSSYQEILKRFNQYKKGSVFTPPSLEGTITMALNGGAEWGGPSVDPETGIMYINANEMAWVIAMKENKPEVTSTKGMTNLEAGRLIYSQSCQSCHGSELKGAGQVPSLEALQKKMGVDEFRQVVKGGRRMMPSFSKLSDSELDAVSAYLLNLKSEQRKKFIPPVTSKDSIYYSPYLPKGYQQFVTKDGLPALAPPWGTLSALDLRTGKYLWKQPLGQTETGKQHNIETGSFNYGGSVVTKGGLLLIAATPDEKFKAYNKRTGKLLFETTLPAAAYATPAVYSIEGRQYIVLACGGGRARGKSSDVYICFTVK